MTDRPTRLRDLRLKTSYQPDDRPRDTFYVPCLRAATRYDRFAGYFRASSLEAVADEGLQPFFSRDGLIRIVVDADLKAADVEEIKRGAEIGGQSALREAVRAQVHKAVLRAELPGTDRLSLIATLVAAGQLQVKVAIAEDPNGIPLHPKHPERAVFHSKIGVFWDDEEEAVAFEGSVNETESGWARNYESFMVFPSWNIAFWEAFGLSLAERFERAWTTGRANRWQLFDLPNPALDRLLELADPTRQWDEMDFPDTGDEVRNPLDPESEDGPTDGLPPEIILGDGDGDPLAEIKAEPWSGIRTATVTPWPHQDAAARAVVTALYPETGEPEFGRMFADEVGLGKTIEVGLVVREAISNRGADRVCILAPASVAPQWQGEVWEKFTLWMPLLVRGNKLRWPDGHETDAGDDPWRSHRWLIASSHLARMSTQKDRVLDAGWDLLVVDEAHHARRSEAGKPGSANKLLRLLRDAAAHPAIKRLVLATATPMQMHVHEAWELLKPLGLPPEWTVEAFEKYWDHLAADRSHGDRDWRHLQQLHAATVARWGIDETITGTLRERVGHVPASKISRWHDSPSPASAKGWDEDEIDALVWWLSEQTPLRHLVHRSSRELLRHYQREGIIGRDVVIPERDADDLVVALELPGERDLYERVEKWISKHYQEAQEAKKPAHGFVMTTYRRRLTSSLHAIRVSLQRRLVALEGRREGTQQRIDLAALLDDDDLNVIEDSDEADTEVDEQQALDELAGLEDEIEEVESFIAAIEKVLDDNRGKDSKYVQFEALLRSAVFSGNHETCIVFTQYTDTMDWLRDHLANSLGPDRVACYSGREGELPNGDGTWRTASKVEVTTAFRDAATNPDNPLKVLLGTDSMSEGLNLQTCDLLINYDLPWNFMRVEQRIGRIDRIGGPRVAYVRNLLIKDSVEERVYKGIVEDHGTFGTVIGDTGKVTGDPSAVLNHTDRLIASVSLEGGDVEEALAELRQAAQEARSRALTAGTFDHSSLDGHDAQDGPWEFDRGDILPRIREALGGRLPEGDDLEGPWVAEGMDGVRMGLTLSPDVATASDAAMAVWGHPAIDGPVKHVELAAQKSTDGGQS